jgi:hypothetical protein
MFLKFLYVYFNKRTLRCLLKKHTQNNAKTHPSADIRHGRTYSYQRHGGA